jgi:hypothetical protein
VINHNNESFSIYLSVQTEGELLENMTIQVDAPAVHYYTDAYLSQLGEWTVQIHSPKGTEPTLSFMVVRNQAEAESIIQQRNEGRIIQWLVMISLIVVIIGGIIRFSRKRNRIQELTVRYHDGISEET